MSALAVIERPASTDDRQSAALKEANQLLVQALADLRYFRHLNEEYRDKLEAANNRIEGQTLQAQKMGSEMLRLRREKGDLNVQRELERQVREMRKIITGLLEGINNRRQWADPAMQKLLTDAVNA